MLLHSIDPWFLARHQPNLERTARNSLARAGFECWFPSYLDIRPTPLRKISPSKRRLAHLFVTEVRRARFPGYLLIRPLPWCQHDPNRLCELHGCGGIVSLGGKVAKIEDFDVELMRLHEAKGTFDTYAGGGARGRYRISRAAADQTWIGQGKNLLRQARELQLAIDALGRVAQLVNGAETALAPKGPPRAPELRAAAPPSRPAP